MLFTSIVTLPDRLPEIGKIKIGKKGKMSSNGYSRLPERLDHFLITTNEKDADDNFVLDAEMHALYGDKPKELPIRLLYNDIELNFQSRYSIYEGTKCVCVGDGKHFFRLHGNEWKPCEVPLAQMQADYKGKDKCKMNGTLSCVIEGAKVIGGVWKLRTVGTNSVTALKSSLKYLQSITQGQLAGIPLKLILTPKTVTIDGKQQKVQIASVVYAGSIVDLQNNAIEIMKRTQMHHNRIQQIETEAKELLKIETDSFDEHPEDIVSEFYPEQMGDEASDETVTKVNDISLLDKLKQSTIPNKTENVDIVDNDPAEMIEEAEEAEQIEIEQKEEVKQEEVKVKPTVIIEPPKPIVEKTPKKDEAEKLQETLDVLKQNAEKSLQMGSSKELLKQKEASILEKYSTNDWRAYLTKLFFTENMIKQFVKAYGENWDITNNTGLEQFKKNAMQFRNEKLEEIKKATYDLLKKFKDTDIANDCDSRMKDYKKDDFKSFLDMYKACLLTAQGKAK